MKGQTEKMKKTNREQSQIIETLKVKGLKEKETIQELKKAAESVGVDFSNVNYLDINANYKDGYCLAWLINHDKDTGKYNYFNESKAVIPLFKEEITKHLENIFHTKDNIARLGESLRLTYGYYFKKAKDNKPQTLAQLKELCEKDFICFVGWNGYRFKTFTIDTEESNKTKPFEISFLFGVDYSFNITDANETRKNAVSVFAICNKELYNKPQAIHTQRASQKKYIDNFYRYDIKKVFDYKYDFMRPSYSTQWNEEQKKYNHVSVSLCGYSLPLSKEYDYKAREEQQKEVFDLFFDKNGYFKRNRIEELKRKAKEKKEENERKAWNVKNKDFYNNKIKKAQEQIKRAAAELNKNNLFENTHLLKHIESLKFLFDKLEYIKKEEVQNSYKNEQDYKDIYNCWMDKITIELILLNDKNINNKELRPYSDYVISGNKIVNRYEWSTYPTPTL